MVNEVLAVRTARMLRKLSATAAPSLHNVASMHSLHRNLTESGEDSPKRNALTLSPAVLHGDLSSPPLHKFFSRIKKGAQWAPFFRFFDVSLVSMSTRSMAMSMSSCCLLLHLFRCFKNKSLGGDEHCCDRGCICERRTRDLHRINDSGLH